ncbi:hypothetical protein BJ322DRAFT_411728 [Thelephora terrestris]|uniref:BTB domain-containing protein n=1 Tax=Thelephora terrestris TaxID=56493 RepID=A0A9P6HND5_9AGAM|nr:hypothetical protein BJ322DRAFT_411728 [Thelephora terrestris]
MPVRRRGPAAFSPPIAMQQSIWDSITEGNFIDAKVFAYSGRARGSGRVHTPKPLFVNTHVLASACAYFRSTFDLSDGIETSLTAGLPPGLDATFDIEENSLTDDYNDVEQYPADEVFVDAEVPSETRVEGPPEIPERTVKAYLVKYTPYNTLRAIIWYIYSGEIFFSTALPGHPVASVESIYQFAEEHGMDHLRSLAFRRIVAPINDMHQSRLIQDAFSPFASRHPQIRDVYVRRLRYFLAYGPNEQFQQELTRYFSGELPRSRDLLASLLRSVMDEPDTGVPSGEDDNRNAILRVSVPWPARTKTALLKSLDCGTFEDIRVAVPSGPEPTEPHIHFAGGVDEQVGATISRRTSPDDHGSELMTDDNLPVCQSESDTEISLLTLVNNWS